MVGNWPFFPLSELTINYDARRVPIKEADRRLGLYPYYGASGIVDYVNDYIFDGEYLLIAEDGENLRTRQTPVAFMASGRFWVNNHAHVVTGNGNASTRFINYALQCTDISSYLTGAVMPKLTQSNLNRIEIPVPSQIIQNRIVDILGVLDDKIKLNRQVAKTLEAMAQALFKSWFVDFGPVRAKAEGRPAKLPDGVAVLFPDQLGKDGLPEGWNAATLLDFFDLEGGGTPKTSVADYWDGDVPWFSVVDTPVSGIYVHDTKRMLTQAGLANCAATLLPENATIVTARGTVGKIALVGRPMAINQSCYAAIAKDNYGPFFIYFLIQSSLEALRTQTHGSVFDTITRSTFASVSTNRPPHALAAIYEAAVTPLLGKMKVVAEQSRALATLRDTLLPKLIFGELRIRDAEQTVVAA
ncbi:restriction endonuclease subunit S [Komagataeibacter medellinensis]|uniref:Type I DNA specificity S subunit n=1 Tax=Komagataeibacter medellinensis (strain NBRC 3288 / BCRC 11682 / LMG 1693 / Kondo 51) TaxID=634177 RepID=G2I140_KOMMN|nr:restriction endonuclease subunit S [Komagataeibacter medellinensis]BAK84648.1 type I DNA specificity S subunit [Komagataeibacter medellinensis NBRC 3288]